jgi:hypothetical protein
MSERDRERERERERDRGKERKRKKETHWILNKMFKKFQDSDTCLILLAADKERPPQW